MEWIWCAFLLLIYKSSALTLEQCLREKKAEAILITREHENYYDVNFQSAFHKIIYPKGYVFVKSTDDVEKAIKCGIMLNIHYAIQSGGHSFEQYSYGYNHSWVLSLKYLNKIYYDEKDNTVLVGPGNRLGNIVNHLYNTCKCAVPVGNCPNVGVSGFVLGGGFGLSSRKHGLLADNVIEMEVVTADAVSRKVNSHQHSDLFWALRGAGGANFGVVTQFKFKTFNASHKYIWISKYYKSSEFHATWNQWHKWQASDVSPSVTSNIIANWQYILLWFAIDNFDQQLSEREVDKIRRFLPSITEEDVGRGSFIDYYNSLSVNEWSEGNNLQFYHKTKSFFVSRLFNEQQLNYFSDFIFKNKEITFVVDMYGGVINQQKATDTAFVHRSSYYNLQFSVAILHPKEKSILETFEAGEKLRTQMNYALTALDFMDSGESYQNYIDEDRIDWFPRYYGINCKRLHRVKWKYDRDEFFNFNQSIVPMFV